MSAGFSTVARMRASRQSASWCLRLRILLKLRARSRNTRCCGLGSPGVDSQHLRDGVEPPCCDPVDAVLVLVSLLVGHPDQVCQALLGKTVHDPPLPQTAPDMPVDVLGSWLSRQLRPRCWMRRHLKDVCPHSVRSPVAWLVGPTVVVCVKRDFPATLCSITLS
jgi:hypothetical protein